ncbi:MAG: hypothetical protein PHS53_03620 [Candidatus Pacebacteria bacterium]|nr:hypothetical protein [Candidatus Paceibacterota bacterium]MDD5357206.1 hypothetical protein [Candidatus Paceibacterota bacterium]
MASKSEELKRKAREAEDQLRFTNDKIRLLAGETETLGRRNKQEKFDLEMKEQKLKREMNEMKELKFRKTKFEDELNQARRGAEDAQRQEEREKNSRR